MANFLPVFFMASGWLCGLCVMFKFNVMSSRLKRRIEAVARSEGSYWTFSDPITAFGLAFRPESLLDPSDSLAMRAEKEAWLEHRRLFPRYFALGMACMASGFGLGVLSLILMACLAS